MYIIPILGYKMELNGTYDCPICGKDTPHEHTDFEIHTYHHRNDMEEINEVAKQQLAEQAKEHAVQHGQRAARQAKVRANLEKTIKMAEIALKQFDEACTFCRSFGDGSQSSRLYHGCDKEYGFTINGDTVTCPVCKRCVAYWGSD